jgi:uncharacterized protein (DUF4415 family)
LNVEHDEMVSLTTFIVKGDPPKDFWDDAVPVLPAVKIPISLRVHADVLAFFRETGPRYQSRINAVLRS